MFHFANPKSPFGKVFIMAMGNLPTVLELGNLSHLTQVVQESQEKPLLPSGKLT